MNRSRTLCAFFLGMLLLIAGGCDRAQDRASDGSPKPTPLAKVGDAAPRPNIGAGDCHTAIELKPQGPLDFGTQGNNTLPVVVSVANRGKAKWGGSGPAIQLGAVWFDANKVGGAHSPNHGEQWWALPAPMNPGETVKFDVSLNITTTPGDYSVWFSVLQPGVMWCFHVGDPPAKLAVRVKKPVR
jgi:hypothetical protein